MNYKTIPIKSAVSLSAILIFIVFCNLTMFVRAALTAVLENDFCRIEFDSKTGELVALENRKLGDSLLKATQKPTIPFRVFSGFKTPWLPTTNNETESTVAVGKEKTKLISADAKELEGTRTLSLRYSEGDIRVLLEVALPVDSGNSQWKLSVENAGKDMLGAVVEFPVLDGVQLGAATANMKQTWLNQVGLIVDAWTQPARVYGNTIEWSMQWHSLYDPTSGSALGIIVEDADALGKVLIEEKPVLKIRYLGPVQIAAGATHKMPDTSLRIYKGDWKPTARAFATWSEKAFKPLAMPAWAKHLDTVNGIHFKKSSGTATADYGGQWLIDNFVEIPQANIRIPSNLTEYAFYSQGSMVFNKHTDGVNQIREDLGGPAAIKEGIAEARKLGLRTCMYVEGFIVPFLSELAKEGKPQRWQIINADGGTHGPYTDQGHYQMCPGSVEWQDYLAEMCARVMKDTGADALRLDSIGFWSMNCYNKEHNHASPYDHNQWVKQLLTKTRNAVFAVNPDALFWIEGIGDFYSGYANTGFTQHKFYVDDVPPMRIAIPGYRPFALTTSGVVWPSLAGLPGGRSQWERDFAEEEANWFCAQDPVHSALVWGDVLSNPTSSDSEIRTRHFADKTCDLLVAVRPESSGSAWGDYGKLSSKRSAFDLLVPDNVASASSIAICDIEKLEWKTVKPQMRDGKTIIEGVSNWMLAVIPKAGHSVVAFDPLSPVKAGEEIEIKTSTLAGETTEAKLEVYAPGLTVIEAPELISGKSFKIQVPEKTFPGLYEISIKGTKVMGIKRYLKVTR